MRILRKTTFKALVKAKKAAENKLFRREIKEAKTLIKKHELKIVKKQVRNAIG